MISKLSYMITDFLFIKGIITKSEREIYHYGYILLLDGVLDTILLLIFGFIIQKPGPTICFILVFSTVRMFAGGYHAKSRWQCILITVISYFVSIELSQKIICLFDRRMFLVVGFVIYYVIFILFAPVENPNKPLDEDEIQANKTKSLVLLSIYVLIIAITSHYHMFYPDVMMVTLLEVMLFMILGILINQRRKGCNER